MWFVLTAPVWEDKRWGSCQMLAVEGEGSTWGFKMFSKGGYTGDGSLNSSKELENKISHSWGCAASVGLGFPRKPWGNLAGSRELQEMLEGLAKGVLFLEQTPKVRWRAGPPTPIPLSRALSGCGIQGR